MPYYMRFITASGLMDRHDRQFCNFSDFHGQLTLKIWDSILDLRVRNEDEFEEIIELKDLFEGIHKLKSPDLMCKELASGLFSEEKKK